MHFQAKITREVNKGNLIAFAEVTVDSQLTLRDVRLMQGEKGMFIGMPSNEWKGRDGETRYTEVYSVNGRGVYEDMLRAVRDAYLTHRAVMERKPAENCRDGPSFEEQEDGDDPFPAHTETGGGYQSLNF